MNRFIFIGGDRRIKYAAEYISNDYPVYCFESGSDTITEDKYRYIVLPLPFSRDGICVNAPMADKPIPLDTIVQYAEKGAVVFSGGSNRLLENLCKDNGLTLIDYLADEPLTLKNAALTAEAALALLIDNTEYSLYGAKVLITGYGRISTYTARLLKVFGADVTVSARKKEQRTKAELDGFTSADISELTDLVADSDIIINTAPSALFEKEHFDNMKPDSLFVELATRKYAPESDLAAASGIKYLPAGGLPGKFSPKTAGISIAQSIISHINEL